MDSQSTYIHNGEALRLAFSDFHIAQQFGLILKRTRIEANLPKPESLSKLLYEQCGVHHSPRSIYRYESGEHSPPLEFVAAVSIITPTLFSDLLTEVLSPGLIGEFEPIRPPIYYDHRNQLELF